MVSAFRVLVQKQAPGTPGSPYLVSHSAPIDLMSPGGQLTGLYPPSDQPAALAAAWQSLTTGAGASGS
jgi:cytochrome oxidase Cu insertion factor (SCO1/SenC/PrrC family)